MVNRNSLPIKHASEAVANADETIREGMIGQQMALHTRHPRIKKALLGGYRFNNTYVIAGASGSGKSYYVNMLYQDFFNPLLNKDFYKPIKILHFCFEMSAADEVIRATSGNTQKSYRDILSVDHVLSNEDYRLIRSYLDTYRNYEIYYVELTGNVQQIYDTIHVFQEKFPDHSIVIGIDHTLLTDYDGEDNEVELVTNVSKMFVKVRKELISLNLQVVQLNADIEDINRINNPQHHFPKKRDIHGAKAVYRDADYVAVLHAPEKLGIELYGTSRIPTKDLIAMHWIKARKGTLGLIKLRDKLSEGTIEEWDQQETILKQI